MKHRFAAALAAAVTIVATISPGTVAAAASKAGAGGAPLVTDPASLVNPLIGTGSGGQTVGQVDTFPGADAPFGMLQWSPDTPSRPDGGGYNYADDATLGFSLTHISGPGCAIDGDVPFLPTTGAIGSDPQGATESFSHASEQATPGYYAVKLGSPAIGSQVSVNQRAGLGEFTYPATAQANMLIKAGDSQNGNAGATVKIVGNDEVTGSSTSGHFCGSPGTYTVHFVAKFSRPFTSSGTWTPSGVSARAKQATVHGPQQTPRLRSMAARLVERKGRQSRLQVPGTSGPATGAYVTFNTTVNHVVKVQVAISYVSLANAQANLRADNPGWDIATLAAQARAGWNAQLGKIQIGGGTAAERTTFYTALYHSLLHPNVYSDANGQYTGFDGKVHQLATGQQAEYTNFSGWDIYRSEMPLLALLDPGQTGDMMQSLVQEEQQGGWMDKWPLASDYTGVMNGDAADQMIAEAAAFGVTGFNLPAALAAMVKGATKVPTSSQEGQGWYVERPNLAAYQKLGYVPNVNATSLSPVDNGASETAEYASADFAIARVALAASDKDVYQRFMQRAQNWENQFNPVTRYLQPRDASGQYPAGNALTVGQSSFGQSGFQEGDAAQYNWAVPQNLAGLITAVGGNAAVVARLKPYFSQLNAGPNAPDYWAGNETDLSDPWVYDYAGAPYLTQRTVRDIIDTLYGDTPGGEPGNDDLGAMSSWYVWAALGLYPQTPGTPVLDVGSPLFPRAVVHLSQHHTVAITAPGAAAGTPYVHGLSVNGQATQRAWVSGSQLLGAAQTTLAFDLSSQPDQAWGKAPADAPPSYRQGAAAAIGFLPRPQVTVAPGGSATVKIGAQDVSGQPVSLTASASPPSGLTVSPGSGTISVPKDGRGTLSVTVHAAASTRQTFYTVPVTFSGGTAGARPGAAAPAAAARVAPVDLTVLVAHPGSLLSTFDNEGISSGTDPAGGNLDGNGFSYAQQALASAGFRPGHQVTEDGVPLTWPRPGPGSPDNTVTDGQQVTLNAPAGAATVGFLGASTDGPGQGVATLTYSDGSTSRYWLGLSDWTLNGNGSQPSFGNQVVATMPYRNGPGGKVTAPTYLFYAGLPVNPSKTLVSVTLPSVVDHGELHVFAVGASKTPMPGAVLSSVAPSPAPAGRKVTVTGSGFGANRGAGYVTLSDLGTSWGSPGSPAAFTVDSWSNDAVTFTVPAPSGTGGVWHVWPGSLASVSVVNASGDVSDTGVLAITPTRAVGKYYDNTGISRDSDQACANLDGDGYSFSSKALAAAGLTPGGRVTSGGVAFTWPAGSACQPDDLLAAGQTLLLAPGASGDTRIGFLGTSTDGASSGPVTITYTDGSTSTVRLGFSDWAGTAVPGEQTVAATPYRNSGSGTSQPLTISVYEVSLPLKAGKTVKSVTLPYVGDSLTGVTAMHIFAIGLG